MDYYIGKCTRKGCKYITRKSGSEIEATPGGFNWGFQCPEHHTFVTFKYVYGTFNQKVVCDARCYNARGHNCECSCGGANHGAAYA